VYSAHAAARSNRPRRLLACAGALLAISLLSSAGARATEPAAAAPPDSPARLPAALDPLVKTYPAGVAAALKGLSEGIHHYLDGEYAPALGALPANTAAATTAVPDLALLYRAKANLALERADEALRDFRLVQSRYPASPELRDAVVGEAQALLKLRDGAGAVTALAHPALPENAEVLYFRGRAQEDAGNQAAAVALFRRVYTGFPLSKNAELAESRLAGLAPGFVTDPANYDVLLERARNLLRGGRNLDAQKLLTRLGPVAPPDRARGEQRRLLLGEAEYNLNHTRLALPLFKNLGSADPERRAQALAWTAASLRRLQDIDGMLEARDEALRSYPNLPPTEKLLYTVATYYDVEGEDANAAEAYKAIVSNFPKGEHAQRARWKLAFSAYLNGNYDEALRGFWNYLFADPEASGAAAPLFWMGRSAEKLGDTRRAAYFYGRAQSLSARSYYGVQAHQAMTRLGQPASSRSVTTAGLDLGAVHKLVDDLQVPAPRIAPPSQEAIVLIERARQLVAADLPDIALGELRSGLERPRDTPVLSYVIARIYETKEDFYGAIVTLRRAFPQYLDHRDASLPEQVWQLLFPVRHLGVISAEASKYQIEPALVLGLIRQESAFNQTAKSRANARGLMQVLPGTGRGVARRSRETRNYTVQKLYRPETNIPLGIRHLQALLQRYSGKRELALAAYNAGESRVDRWMQRFGASDLAQFVEQIPFSETRGYVKQVLSNQAHYLRLTAGTPGSGQ
jgi:soluble lytic murein transglycosylase